MHVTEKYHILGHLLPKGKNVCIYTFLVFLFVSEM